MLVKLWKVDLFFVETNQSRGDVPEKCQADVDQNIGAAAGDYHDSDGRDL